jgi:microcystin-dependent protein
MSEPFLAEIKIFAFNFAPRGWAFCDGQILPINQNQSLYSLLGTTYGGDGRTSFGLPDMRGRTPIHVDNGHPLGQKSGEEAHTISVAEMPTHSHHARGTNQQANQKDPTGNVWAAQSEGTHFGSATPNSSLNNSSISQSGGGQSHENMQPFTSLRFCIAIQGLFPSRN